MPVLRLIPVRWHSILDLLLVAFSFATPFLFGYAGAGAPAQYTWGLAAFALVFNALTDYPLGLFKIIPAKVHSLLEWTGPGVFIGIPLVYFSDSPAGVAIPAVGLVNLTYNALTDWPKTPSANAVLERA